MIIFHEGLPRSGKSYEAVAFQIIPALQEGRKVFTNIKGINHEKIADILEMEIDLIKTLLIQVEWDDTPKMHQIVENDSLVVIDEIQDFWPTKASKKMPNDVQQWITQHGHKGLDIVLMGQDMRDVDPIWRRRVDQKIVFTKLGALGMDTRYSWQNYKATSAEKFQKISDGQKKYDEKYFGTYQSHEPETRNKANKQDDRSNLFKTKAFRFWLPLAALLGIFAINWLWSFFHKPNAFAKKEEPQAVASAPASASQVVAVPPGTILPAVPPGYKIVPESQPSPNKVKESEAFSKDVVEEMLRNTRPRLSGFIRSSETGQVAGLIEFMDESFHVKESLTFTQLVELGYTIKPVSNAVYIINKIGQRLYVSSWPIDPFGRVAENESKRLNSNEKTN